MSTAVKERIKVPIFFEDHVIGHMMIYTNSNTRALRIVDIQPAHLFAETLAELIKVGFADGVVIKPHMVPSTHAVITNDE